MLDALEALAHVGRGKQRRNYIAVAIKRKRDADGLRRSVHVVTVREAKGKESADFTFPAGARRDRITQVITKAVKAFDLYLADKRKEPRR